MKVKSWDDISINKFIKIYTIENTIKDILEKELHILSVLNDISYEEIENWTISKIQHEINQLKFMQILPFEKKIKHSFRYKNNVYKVCLLDNEKKAAQFIDFTTICKDVKPEDMILHATDLIGCMLQKRKYYLIPPFIRYEYEGYDKIDLGDMPMSQIYPYYVFFCKVSTNLYQDMVNSSIEETKKQIKNMKKILKRNKGSMNIGDGSVL